MYIFGGMISLEPFVPSNNLHSLDLDMLYWSEVKCEGMIPSPRESMSLVEHSGFLYLFGGKTKNQEFSNELFSLNLERDKKWKMIQAKNEYPCKRTAHTIIAYENGIFIMGGTNHNRMFSDFFYLNLLSSYKEKKLTNQADRVSRLYLDSAYSDVMFLIEGEKIFGHKNILGIRCKYFSNMFSSGMKESTQKEIEITDCKAASFKALLKYIYCDEIDFTESLALDLLVLSDKWLFKELEEECEDYLGESLTVENIVERAELANKLEAERLISSVIQFIIEKMHELKERGDLSEIPASILAKAILQQGNRAGQAEILREKSE